MKSQTKYFRLNSLVPFLSEKVNVKFHTGRTKLMFRLDVKVPVMTRLAECEVVPITLEQEGSIHWIEDEAVASLPRSEDKLHV